MRGVPLTSASLELETLTSDSSGLSADINSGPESVFHGTSGLGATELTGSRKKKKTGQHGRLTFRSLHNLTAYRAYGPHALYNCKLREGERKCKQELLLIEGEVRGKKNSQWCILTVFEKCTSVHSYLRYVDGCGETSQASIDTTLWNTIIITGATGGNVVSCLLSLPVARSCLPRYVLSYSWHRIVSIHH